MPTDSLAPPQLSSASSSSSSSSSSSPSSSSSLSYCATTNTSSFAGHQTVGTGHGELLQQQQQRPCTPPCSVSAPPQLSTSMIAAQSTGTVSSVSSSVQLPASAATPHHHAHMQQQQQIGSSSSSSSSSSSVLSATQALATATTSSASSSAILSTTSSSSSSSAAAVASAAALCTSNSIGTTASATAATQSASTSAASSALSCASSLSSGSSASTLSANVAEAAAAAAAVAAASATPPPQQFCLRWNNYQTNLTSVFDQLLQSESFVDVTLACDGHSIKAHKMVLSACSPYFQALFFDNPCQHPIIIMRDVKWPELKAVVEFMYKGEINVSQDQIGPLLRVAEMLKIRGLADVTGGERELNAASPLLQSSGAAAARNAASPSGGITAPVDTPLSDMMMAAAAVAAATAGNSSAPKKARMSRNADNWDTPDVPMSPAPPPVAVRNRKRRWPSGEHNSAMVAAGSSPPALTDSATAATIDACPPPSVGVPPSSPVASSAAVNAVANSSSTPIPPYPHPAALEAMGLSSLALQHPDEMEIKPGIAEMIREEERAKLLENSHAWLGASTSSIADSYQYQLQSMWQKCWNTNQNLIHHLRFRERGPLKSWRPETMAEAIFSVLKEGLSLSQAARKYDIPYPTFVLYANRVHNMLGPSIDGGTDLRPKGRGRPQRILLGIWPDEHIKGVIKTVVFRDAKELKDDAMHLQYGRHSPVFPFQDPALGYGVGGPCANGQPNAVAGTDTMSPDAATAAAVAAVAHGIRQQIQMAAAGHHVDGAGGGGNLVAGFNLPAHCASLGMQGGGGGGQGSIPPPKLGSPTSGGGGGSQGGIPMPRHTSPHHGHGHAHGHSINQHQHQHQHQQNIAFAGHNMTAASMNQLAGSLAGRLGGSPSGSAHDLRMASPSQDDSRLHSPLEMGNALEPAVNLAVGVSGMAYKPSRGYSSPRPEHLFQEDIADLVGASRSCPSRLNAASAIKMEPLTECRGD